MSDLRGFNYSNVSLRKVQKDKFVLAKELEQQISRDELKKKMVAVLNSNGKVYFICKKRKYVALLSLDMKNILQASLNSRLMENQAQQRIWVQL